MQAFHHFTTTPQCFTQGALQNIQPSTILLTHPLRLEILQHSLIIAKSKYPLIKAYGSLDFGPEFITNYPAGSVSPCEQARHLTRSIQAHTDAPQKTKAGIGVRTTNWVPNESPVHQTDLEFWRWNQPQTVNVNKIEAGIDIRTTIMLRNAPNRVDFGDLKLFLDDTSEGHYDFSSMGMFPDVSDRFR